MSIFEEESLGQEELFSFEGLECQQPGFEVEKGATLFHQESDSISGKFHHLQSHLSHFQSHLQNTLKPSPGKMHPQSPQKYTPKGRKKSDLTWQQIADLDRMFLEYFECQQKSIKCGLKLVAIAQRVGIGKKSIYYRYREFKKGRSKQILPRKVKDKRGVLMRIIKQTIQNRKFNSVSQLCYFISHKYDKFYSEKKVLEMLVKMGMALPPCLTNPQVNQSQIEDDEQLAGKRSENEKVLRRIMHDIFSFQKPVLYFSQQIIQIGSNIFYISILCGSKGFFSKITQLHNNDPQLILKELLSKFSREFTFQKNWMLILGIQQIYQLNNIYHINQNYYLRKNVEIEKIIMQNGGKMLCLPPENSHFNPATHCLQMLAQEKHTLHNLGQLQEKMEAMRSSHEQNFKNIICDIFPFSPFFSQQCFLKHLGQPQHQPQPLPLTTAQ